MNSVKNIRYQAKSLFILCVLIFVSACQQKTSTLTKKDYFIFGTIVEVLVWHDDDQSVTKALLDVEAELNGMHTQWHAWKAGKLNNINKALRSGNSIKLTPEEAEFIQVTKDLSKQSKGYFNPAIGELINLWGFHTDNYPILDAPPHRKKILDYLTNIPKMEDLIFDGNNISSTNPRIWLDYGGVAKGYAIDKAINILKKYGIDNAIVNAGGDLRSIGSKGDKNWNVAIRKPNSERILTVIQVIGDESVFTSGNYERYKEFDGKRFAHIINPKTGYGVEEIVSATVIAENGTLADAAATALIVAGSNNWQVVAESMQLQLVLLINAEGECFATQQMIDRLNDSQLDCKVLL